MLARPDGRAAAAPGGYVKKIQSLSFLATLAFAVGMISWGSALHAQTTPSTDPSQQTQQPSSTPDTTPTQQQPQTQPTPSPEMPPSSQQTPSAQTPDTTTPQSGSQTGSAAGSGAAATSATDSQTFSGTVVKQGDKYVLRDDSGQTYDIDHQDEVKKFDGKRVRVQGTLDPTGKKIMVK
jgi:Protein of unknown function (DUF5818)